MGGGAGCEHSTNQPCSLFCAAGTRRAAQRESYRVGTETPLVPSSCVRCPVASRSCIQQNNSN
jgi:hypothetical protein